MVAHPQELYDPKTVVESTLKMIGFQTAVSPHKKFRPPMMAISAATNASHDRALSLRVDNTISNTRVL